MTTHTARSTTTLVQRHHPVRKANWIRAGTRGDASVHCSSAEASHPGYRRSGYPGKAWWLWLVYKPPGGFLELPGVYLACFVLLYFTLNNIINLSNLSILRCFAGSVRPFPGHMHLAVCHEQQEARFLLILVYAHKSRRATRAMVVQRGLCLSRAVGRPH